MLWLIAAESENGTVPSEKDVAWRLRLPIREVTSDVQLLGNFLEPVYADSRDSLASDRDREETEGEGERAGKPAATTKASFGDHVLLTQSEHDSLKEKLNGNAQSYIERLDGYIGQIGTKKAAARYRSHYHTILNWWRKDVAEGKAAGQPAPDTRPKCSRCHADPATESGGLCRVCAKALQRNKPINNAEEVDVTGLVKDLAERLAG